MKKNTKTLIIVSLAAFAFWYLFVHKKDVSEKKTSDVSGDGDADENNENEDDAGASSGGIIVTGTPGTSLVSDPAMEDPSESPLSDSATPHVVNNQYVVARKTIDKSLKIVKK